MLVLIMAGLFILLRLAEVGLDIAAELAQFYIANTLY